MVNAIINWPPSRVDGSFLEAIIASGDARALFRIGLVASCSSWDPRVAEGLIATGDLEYIFEAINTWMSYRLPVFTEFALNNDVPAVVLYTMGLRLPSENWDPRIAEALIATGNMGYINQALSCWLPKRTSGLLETA